MFSGVDSVESLTYSIEDFMYHHIKKLMFTVRVDNPDPRFGNMLLEQFGGAGRT